MAGNFMAIFILHFFLKTREQNSDNNPSIKTMAYLQVAWCYSLGQSLRESRFL